MISALDFRKRLAEYKATHVQQIGQPDLLDIALRAGEKIAGIKHDRIDEAPNNQSDANVRHQLSGRQIQYLRVDQSQRNDRDRGIRR